MKKFVMNTGKMILYYLISIIIVNILGAVLLQKCFEEKTLYEIFFLMLCNNSQIREQQNIFVNGVVAIKNLVEGIALAVLASYIFTNILNREVKIIFPEKIVIRRRTSEGSEGKLTLGILIGNPGKKQLCDVKCSMNCTYLKASGEIEQRNGETFLKESVEAIENFYRFSFDLKKLPKVFWKHYLEKNEEYVNKDFINITIMGKTDGMGGYFRVSHRYGLQDIIVDIHSPEKYFRKKVRSLLTFREKIKIDWREFPKSIEAGEDERQDIIMEIRQYASEKDYTFDDKESLIN